MASQSTNRLSNFLLKPIHPFPARMAPSIVWDELPCSTKKKLTVLDPMSGSGTTLATARMRGHQAIGFDTDPLAILISKSWCSDIGAIELEEGAKSIISTAKKVVAKLSSKKAFPPHANNETQKFIKFWFDVKNRKQLTALAQIISQHKNKTARQLYWCAFSRMIITKKSGVSLGMDISHSRPHKTYTQAPITAFELFPKMIRIIKQNISFNSQSAGPKVKIKNGDARQLPLASNSVDVVITSPPYFNAIDYMRGHKLSLVWMGYNISDLSKIRGSNIGAEKISKTQNELHETILSKMGATKKTPARTKGMLRRYICDMDKAIGEIKRVLHKKGKAVFVIGDCSLKGGYIFNSKMIKNLSSSHGLKLEKYKKRPLPTFRRYLPPPTLRSAGKELGSRMREEIIATFSKP